MCVSGDYGGHSETFKLECLKLLWLLRFVLHHHILFHLQFLSLFSYRWFSF